MIEIIPAIDLISGRCVRLSQGRYGSEKVYDGKPEEIARRYADAGIRRLHIVDLDGAKNASPKNLAVVEKIAGSVPLEIEFGGGLKTAEAVASVFDAGAAYAICGSLAVTGPDLFREILKKYGAGRIVLGADVRDGKVATHGWLQISGLCVEDLIDMYAGAGLRRVICTDISRDGMFAGPAVEMYSYLQGKYPEVDIIASGGVSSVEDIAGLEKTGIRGAVVGKAIYEGRISLPELGVFLN